MVDIASIKPIERDIELTNPADGSLLGIRVTVMSINDDRLKPLKRKFRDEANRLAAKNKTVKAETEEQNSIDLLWAATTGWEWYNPTGAESDKGYDADAMPEWGDEGTPAYTEKNFKDFARNSAWAVAQLVNEIDEERAFFTS